MIVRVSVPTGTILPKAKIKKALDDAWSTFDYAKFTLSNGIYVTVTYNRDKSITIGTNSRDLSFYNEYQAVLKVPTHLRLVDLLFRWLPKLRS